MLEAVFVGNGDMPVNHSAIVNSSDLVIRSQHCANYLGKAGKKTDILCVRPSNEPFGTETATEKKIPRQAADDCTHLLMCSRRPNPSLVLLYKNYPQLCDLPLLRLTEDDTRKLLLSKGARVVRDDGQLNPTMGMCLLHWFVENQMYQWVRLTCVGFAWKYKFDDHDQNLERDIQREWMRRGCFNFK